MEGLTDYLLTQGVLGFVVLIMSGVIIYQQRKLDKKEARIEELMQARLDDALEIIEKTSEIMSDSSQTLRLLTEKIESAKGRR